MNNDLKISLQFLGAAGTVTGSKFLIKTPSKNILIDCGIFQGIKKLRELNWSDLPFDPAKIDHVLLTHAHLDHVGFLPRLVKRGYNKPVYCTAPTAELAEILLLDSAHIQEEDARLANKHGFSKHEPAMPLYDVSDAKAAIKLLQPKDDNRWFEVDENIKFQFRRNGHILGATFIELEIYKKRFVFSGDIGRIQDPMLEIPERPAHADVIVMESTYGNRIHKHTDTLQEIKTIVNEAYKNRSSLIIPSFTVDRAQDLMYYLYLLEKKKEIPNLPIYLDSPMGFK